MKMVNYIERLAKFKEFSKFESAKNIVRSFGKLVFTPPELWKLFKAENKTAKQAFEDAFGNFLDAGKEWINSAQNYAEELARYNNQLRKNAKEVK